MACSPRGPARFTGYRGPAAFALVGVVPKWRASDAVGRGGRDVRSDRDRGAQVRDGVRKWQIVAGQLPCGAGVGHQQVAAQERIETASAATWRGPSWRHQQVAAQERIETQRILPMRGPIGVTNKDEARVAIFEWLVWYNRERLHSSIGYQPPEEYEDQLLNSQAA
jgi:hypothetical protein